VIEARILQQPVAIEYQRFIVSPRLAEQENKSLGDMYSKNGNELLSGDI